MTAVSGLLFKAYTHIDAGNVQFAADILDELVRNDPANVEAWEAYMQICGSHKELDLLYERILLVPGVAGMDRESIRNYYYFLREKIGACGVGTAFQGSVTLELIDQFSFTVMDQNSHPGRLSDGVKFNHGFISLFGKLIAVPYAVLLFAGLNLLLTGDVFGYWILVGIALSIVANTWRGKHLAIGDDRRLSPYRSIFSNGMTL